MTVNTASQTAYAVLLEKGARVSAQTAYAVLIASNTGRRRQIINS